MFGDAPRIVTGTFKLAFDAWRITAPISVTASAATIQAAINAVLGTGSASCTGSLLASAGGVVITLTNGYGHGYSNNSYFWIDASNVQGDDVNNVGYYLKKQGAPIGLIYILPAGGPISGTFTLSFPSSVAPHAIVTTAPIPWNAEAVQVKAILLATPGWNGGARTNVSGGPLPSVPITLRDDILSSQFWNFSNMTVDTDSLIWRRNVLRYDLDGVYQWGDYIARALTSVDVDSSDRLIVGSKASSISPVQTPFISKLPTIRRYSAAGAQLWEAHNGDNNANVTSVAVTADGERVWTGTVRSDKTAFDLDKT